MTVQEKIILNRSKINLKLIEVLAICQTSNSRITELKGLLRNKILSKIKLINSLLFRILEKI